MVFKILSRQCEAEVGSEGWHVGACFDGAPQEVSGLAEIIAKVSDLASQPGEPVHPGNYINQFRLRKEVDLKTSAMVKQSCRTSGSTQVHVGIPIMNLSAEN